MHIDAVNGRAFEINILLCDGLTTLRTEILLTVCDCLVEIGCLDIDILDATSMMDLVHLNEGCEQPHAFGRIRLDGKELDPPEITAAVVLLVC